MSTTLKPDLTNFARSFKYGWYIETKRNESIELIIRDPERYIELRLNPSQISVDEPAATSIQYTQDGGKYIESRGWVKKMWTVSGSTGFLPPGSVQNLPGLSADRVVRVGPNVRTSRPDPAIQARRSGFAEFHKLRNLFARFLDLRRDNKHVRMFWMNFKDDEFWEVEPLNFRRPRTAQKPFTYEYTVQFQGIQPADRVAQQTRDERLVFVGTSTSRARASILGLFGRLQEMRLTIQKIVGLTSGKIQVACQLVSQTISNVVGLADDIRSGVNTFIDLPINIFRHFAQAIKGCFNVLGTSGLTRPVELEINAFLVEGKKIADSLIYHVDRAFGNQAGASMAQADEKFTQPRGKLGSATDLFPEEGTAQGSLSKHVITGQSGMDQVIDLRKYISAKRVKVETINHGENIYDLAERLLGSIHTFMVLVIINHLEFPYIIEDRENKPPNTLAWGEEIQIPVEGEIDSAVDGAPVDAAVEAFSGSVTAVGASNELIDATQSWREGQLIGFTVTITSGAATVDAKRVVVDNTATKITLNRDWSVVPAVGSGYKVVLDQFSLRKPVRPDTRAYGRDLLLAFTNFSSIGMVGDIRLNARGDLAMVEGEENFEQAMTILMNTPRGNNRFHPDYGLGLVIGQKVDETVMLLYTFCVRQSMLRDPRVENVFNAQYAFEGGKSFFEATVQPVAIRTAKYFRRAV